MTTDNQYTEHEVTRLRREHAEMKTFIASLTQNSWLLIRSEGQPHQIIMQANALLSAIDTPADPQTGDRLPAGGSARYTFELAENEQTKALGFQPLGYYIVDNVAGTIEGFYSFPNADEGEAETARLNAANGSAAAADAQAGTDAQADSGNTAITRLQNRNTEQFENAAEYHNGNFYAYPVTYHGKEILNWHVYDKTKGKNEYCVERNIRSRAIAMATVDTLAAASPDTGNAVAGSGDSGNNGNGGE